MKFEILSYWNHFKSCKLCLPQICIPYFTKKKKRTNSCCWCKSLILCNKITKIARNDSGNLPTGNFLTRLTGQLNCCYPWLRWAMQAWQWNCWKWQWYIGLFTIFYNFILERNTFDIDMQGFVLVRVLLSLNFNCTLDTWFS